VFSTYTNPQNLLLQWVIWSGPAFTGPPGTFGLMRRNPASPFPRHRTDQVVAIRGDPAESVPPIPAGKRCSSRWPTDCHTVCSRRSRQACHRVWLGQRPAPPREQRLSANGWHAGRWAIRKARTARQRALPNGLALQDGGGAWLSRAVGDAVGIQPFAGSRGWPHRSGASAEPTACPS